MTTPGGAYSAGTIFLQVVPSFRNFQKTIRAASKEMDKAFAESLTKGELTDALDSALDKAAKKAAPKAGTTMADLMARDLSKRLDNALKNLTPVLRLRADGGTVMREIERITKQISQIRDNVINLDAKGVEKAEREISMLLQQLKALDGADARPDVRASVANAVAGIEKVEGDLRKLDGQTATVHLRAQGFDRFIQNAEGAGQALRGFNALILIGAATIPALVPVLAAATGALVLFGTAAIGAAAGLGVMVLGFSGIGDAVKAMGKVSEDGAEQARALAKTQRAAGRAVQDAQRGVADATRNAGEAAAASAERVQDAQRAVVRAHEDAKRGVQRALRGVEQAERSLADAQRDSQRAQESLRDARKAARDDMADLESRVKAGALAERQALVDLFEAQVAYNNVQSDGGATNLEREEAAIQLERARLAIADQRRENEALRAEQAKANREGVEGSEKVVAARERVADAAVREQDAQRQVGEAQENVQRARVDGAQRIADAERNLAQAQAASARSAADSQLAIANAQRGLADAQANYADALAQTTSAADELADSMAKLSPAGQAFAVFLFSLRDQFRQLRDAAQAGMLPGVEQALRNLLPYMPQITAFVGVMGKALGDMFVKASEVFTSPIWLDFFRTLGEVAPTFIDQFSTVFLNLLTVFAQVATAAAPLAVKFGDALVRLTNSLVGFLDSERGQQLLTDLLGYVERIGPKVADFLGALAGAFANLVRALAPYGETILSIFTGILRFIEALPPSVLGALVFGLLSMVLVFQIFAGLLGALGSVAGILGTLGSLFAGFGVLSLAAAASFALIAAGLLALGVAVVVLYTQSETFRKIVDAAFSAIGKVLNAFWEIGKFVFKALIGTIREFVIPVIGLLIGAFLKLTPTGYVISQLWERVIKPVFNAFTDKTNTLRQAFETMVSGIGSAWDSLKEFLRAPLFFVVNTLLNNGLIAGFNKLADFFGSPQIDKIPLDNLRPAPKKANTAPRSTARVGGVQAFASGGQVGGYSPSPTADNIIARLTAGEYVLPVNAVKRLKAAYGDQFLEWLRQGGGYAKGGLVEFGRLLQSRGFRVAEHPAFGGVRGRHSKNSYHYSGQAIDVNYGPGGTSAVEQRAIDAIIGLAKEYDLRTIWRTAGHFDHAHFDTGGSRGSILGKLGDLIGNAVEWAKDGPIGWLQKQVTGLYDGLPNNGFGGFLRGGVDKVLDFGLGFVHKIAGLAGDFVGRDDEPKLYDQGGWLPPGMSQIVNATGRPELILTPEQADAVLAGGGQYQINVPMMPTDSTPAEVADAVLFAARQIARGGVYAGRR